MSDTTHRYDLHRVEDASVQVEVEGKTIEVSPLPGVQLFTSPQPPDGTALFLDDTAMEHLGNPDSVTVTVTAVGDHGRARAGAEGGGG